mgnify:CR=1 FL=1
MSKNVISIAKFEPNTINEDSAICRNNIVAVSDGAGGGGVFAEKWSMYLLENLPDKPIVNAEELDTWIDEIWEQFYNEYEKKAAAIGGLFLSKFYDEGSFATLAAAWKISENDVILDKSVSANENVYLARGCTLERCTALLGF